jgi:hypothetical protein
MRLGRRRAEVDRVGGEPGVREREEREEIRRFRGRARARG